MERGTPDDVVVRRLTADDVEGAVEVLVRAFNEFAVSVHVPPTFGTFSQARSTLRMALDLDPGGSWVATLRARKVVGLAVAYRRGSYVSIGPVAVHPLSQGRGVGRALIERVVHENREADCLALVHAATNPVAFTLYRTAGFRVVYPEATFAGVPSGPVRASEAVRAARSADMRGVLQLDRELSGVDRSRELDLLAGLGTIWLAEDGYLVSVETGEARAVGPGAAATAGTMHALIGAAVRSLPPGGLSIRVPANGAAFDALAGLGLHPESLGNVMALGRWPQRRGEHVHPIFPEVL